ncbi:thiamine phosphate synthase [Mesonia sp. K4-1]|uniref:thiamine phosphate synthase n=1 Tax=Mesonia sp. K4-1 TaxID=2602760 RepID=UPI0011C97153|nr:thiamine phosphate synthase [Mesonia sp. K4-1]TXK76423.1 thiamine phosphate synthase [Mesonia sp. K4-1]
MIPKLHYIAQGSSPKDYLDNIQNACTSGIELIQLGIPKLVDKKFLKLAQEARETTSHFQTRLIIEDRYKIAKEIKADGVLMNNPNSYPTLRKHLHTWQMMAGKANTLQDCEFLLSKEVDYIVLGPFKTTTKEDNTTLGVNGFTAITDVLNTETPMIGTGNILIEDVKDILAAGISGIAVAEEITEDFHCIRTYNQLLNASVTEEQRHSF